MTVEIVEVTENNLAAAVEFTSAWVTGGEASAKQHFSDHPRGDATSCIAIIGDEIGGLVTIRWKSNYEGFRSRNIPLLHQIAVAEPFRKQKIATQLMDVAEELARVREHKALGITVGLFEQYGAAQRLYAKRGYIPDGRGACVGKVPVKENEIITANHDLIMWLIKDL